MQHDEEMIAGNVVNFSLVCQLTWRRADIIFKQRKEKVAQGRDLRIYEVCGGWVDDKAKLRLFLD